MSHRRVLVGAALLLACAVVAVFCAGAMVPGGATSAKAAAGVVLTVKHNGTLIKQYTLDDLQALAVYNGYAGIKNSALNVTGPEAVTGVRVADILQDALGTGITSEQSLDDSRRPLSADDHGRPGHERHRRQLGHVQHRHRGRHHADRRGHHRPALVHLGVGARRIGHLPSDEGPLRLYVADSVSEPVVMRGSDSEYQVTTLNGT